MINDFFYYLFSLKKYIYAVWVTFRLAEFADFGRVRVETEPGFYLINSKFEINN